MSEEWSVSVTIVYIVRFKWSVLRCHAYAHG